MEQKKADDQFYVMATSSLTEEATFTLKHDDSFAIFNKYGDVLSFDKSVQGIFHNGTRFLSAYRFKIENQKPLYLSSDLREDNEMFSVDLTNPDIVRENSLRLEKGLIHIMRKKVLWDGNYYEQIFFSNFGLDNLTFTIDFTFDADFSDIFEVRGTERMKKGVKLPLKTGKNNIRIGYAGLDNRKRDTNIILKPDPDRIEGSKAAYEIRLAAGQNFIVNITMSFIVSGEKESEVLTFPIAIKKHKRRLDYIHKESVDIFTSNEQFNHWVNRSKADLITMITDTPYGPYPYAGIPWYNTPFGRDAIITALECLWINPDVAKGVLSYLAATQAKDEDPYRDSEPGKILHEARKGEMAALNEIPFGHYYGSIDSTPLFIVLAGAYFNRTGDIGTIKSIWQNIELALTWIDKYGDIDGDMFIEYIRKKKSGLYNQGWKDSHDAISYSDGSLAEAPIALCEVQGYVYDAWMKASVLSDALDMKDKAAELRNRADQLNKKFNEIFWSDEKSTFYLALAAGKKPCNVLASNAGHCLFSGIATFPHAEKTAAGLLCGSMFTGWGIRTLSSEEVRFNPMSYHDGSVWPHDNALIAYGLSRYGLKNEVKIIATGLFDASLHIEGQRLPELFCGFRRRQGEGPTAYPVACSPQAWSVASVFMIVQALLGMEINENEKVIRFYRPVLPDFIEWLKIRNLKFLGHNLNLEFVKTAENVDVGLLNKDKQVRLEIIY